MPARGLSYKDAVRILGREDNAALAALDKMAGGLLLIASAGGSQIAVSLFDVKGEFVKLSGALWQSLAAKLRGLNRFDRTERITAAHAVIVISSFFDTIAPFDEKADLLRDQAPNWGQWARIPPEIKVILAKTYRLQVRRERDRLRDENPAYRGTKRSVVEELDKQAQIAASTRRRPDTARLKSLAETLLCTELPMPAPQRSYTQTKFEIGDFYADVAQRMREVIVGPEWETLEPKEQERFTTALCSWVKQAGLAKYEIQFRRLATDFPEVNFWASMVELEAIDNKARDIEIGLKGLELMVKELAQGSRPTDVRRAISDIYKTALNRAIVETGELPSASMRIPDLGSAYINPTFRASDVGINDRLNLESWWDDRARQPRSDLQDFMLGYLTSAEAVRAPLLVLGQPGSGKSVLTKTLAARLPPNEFLTVRVSLRDVAAEADIQTQIEQALYDATGERTEWPALTRAAGDALPVIMLDGFDELLQATGVSQSDYLERVVRFQERESDNHRPCVVIVTSRTAVADRARIPVGGVAAIRLEAFDEFQITRWLQVWNHFNTDYFKTQGLNILPASVVLEQGDLASQPLLLLMLALYDADDNALQTEKNDLGHAQLYERLLSRFAEREVRKEFSNLSEVEMGQHVEQELMRLSIAAIAMFNRARQWATEEELDSDLMALLPEASARGRKENATTFRSTRSLGETVLGRFFFIHEARAVVEGVNKGTFEFLHATFGEFLVSRVVYKELEDIAKTEELASTKARRADVDDAFLYALLSFAPLSARATTIEFLGNLLLPMTTRLKQILRDLLLSLFGASLDMRRPSRFDDYEPVVMHVPARCASYSANLLVLALLIGGEVRGSEIFRETDEVVSEWSRQALLWRSQLSAEGWGWLSESIDLVRIQEHGKHDIVLRPRFTTREAMESRDEEIVKVVQPDAQLYWAFERPFSRAFPQWSSGGYGQLRGRYEFTCDLDDEIIIHALSPIFEHLGSSITTFLGSSPHRCASGAHALIKLWLVSCTRAGSEYLTQSYDECIELGVNALHYFDPVGATNFRQVLVRQLAVDLKRMPGIWRAATRDRLLEIDRTDPDLAIWIDSLIESLGLKSR